jgi:PPOX class probable F420-dependent enzyme
MPNAIAQFAGANYLNLETFRKTGVGVRTPVWFAQDVSHSTPSITVFYIYSEAGAGKVKRIRNNPRVRVAPATCAGTYTAPGSTGAPVSAKMTRLLMVSSC